MAAEIHPSLTGQADDPETAALQVIAEYLAPLVSGLNIVAAYSGQDPEMLAHEITNRGTHIFLRTAGLERVDGPRHNDPVRLAVDFLVGAGCLERSTAVSRAAALAWEARSHVIDQSSIVPFQCAKWTFVNTVGWLETETVHIKSMILSCVCALRDWESQV